MGILRVGCGKQIQNIRTRYHFGYDTMLTNGFKSLKSCINWVRRRGTDRYIAGEEFNILVLLCLACAQYNCLGIVPKNYRRSYCATKELRYQN